MQNKKLIIASILMAFICLNAVSLNATQKNQDAAAASFRHTYCDPIIKKKNHLVYYLFVDDFINSLINIPTSNVSVYGSTIDSKYLAGRAPIYKKNGKQ